jgi:hypothetical protein
MSGFDPLQKSAGLVFSEASSLKSLRDWMRLATETKSRLLGIIPNRRHCHHSTCLDDSLNDPLPVALVA